MATQECSSRSVHLDYLLIIELNSHQNKKSDSAETMSMSSLMTDFLRKAGGTAVIDGGLATELERYGADLNDPLWSSKCLLTSPDLIRQAPLSLSSFCFMKFRVSELVLIFLMCIFNIYKFN